MRRRLALGFAIAAAIVVPIVLCLFFAQRWLGSDDARERLERILSEALGRPVAIGGLEVDVAGGSVELRDVEVATADGFSGAPLLRAERLQLEVALEALLDREVVGVLHASGLDLHVAIQGGRTNLADLVVRGAGEPVDLDLELVIDASRVVVEDVDRGESIAFDGVGLGARLSNREAVRTADATVTMERVDLHALALHEVSFVAHAREDQVEIRELRGTPGRRGSLTGSGRASWREHEWSFVLAAEGVDVAEVLPVVGAIYPPLAAVAADPTAPVRGEVGAAIQLNGRGFHWDTVRPTLAGRGTVGLVDVEIPARSLLLQLAELAGRAPGPLALQRGRADIAIADGWVELAGVEVEGAPFTLPVRGRVSLVGELDLVVDLMPAVRVFGGGIYGEVARYTTSLPVRVRGTTSAPELAPPTPGDVAEGLVGGLVRRALGPEPAVESPERHPR